MKNCPVCEAPLKFGADICSVCDTDISIAREMSFFPNTLCQLAEQAVARDDHTQAMVYYRVAQEMHPLDVNILRGLAKELDYKGQSEEAIDIWHKVITLAPTDTEAIRRLSELRRLAKESKKKQGLGIRRNILKILALILIFGWSGYIIGSKFFAPEKTIIKEAPPKIIAQPPQIITQTSQKPCIPKSEIPPEKLAAMREELRPKLPAGIEVETKNSGLFLRGEVKYPWDKQAIEQTVLNFAFAFVDITHLKVEQPYAVRYQVKRGDTLYSIARQFLGKPRTWKMLYSANQQNLASPHKLAVGQSIIVYTQMPDTTKVDLNGAGLKEAHAVLYSIKNGDTLTSIASSLLGDSEMWRIIYDSNRDMLPNPNKLTVGQKIMVYTKLPKTVH